MTRVAVIGSRGQLGSELVLILQQAGDYHILPLTHDDLDVTDPQSISRALTAAHPDVVVNCAAFVRVDDSEDRPEEAFRVNALGAWHVARWCAVHDAWCVYISTDYVFDGHKHEPYIEEDHPSPINVYGVTKLAGEHLVRQACPRWLIVRTASLFGKVGARGKGGNFVDTIIAKIRRGESLQVVNDITMSPTYARDAAAGIARLLNTSTTGLVHVANTGSCTWYEFARTIIHLLGVKWTLEPVPASAYPRKARRPASSPLASVRFHGMRPWGDALRAYLHERGRLSDGD